MTTIPPGRRAAIAAAAIAAGLAVALTAIPAVAQESSVAPAVFADVNRALEVQRSGVPYHWTDPRRRHSGTIIVRRTYYVGSQPCRDYTRTTEVGGTLVSTTNGTGCRIGTGIWSLTEQPTQMTGASPPPSPAPRTDPGDTASGAPSDASSEEDDLPAFDVPAPGRKPVLIFASRPTPSAW